MNSSKLNNIIRKSNKDYINIKKDVKQDFNKRKLKIHIPDTKVKLKKNNDYDESEPEIKHREVEINI